LAEAIKTADKSPITADVISDVNVRFTLSASKIYASTIPGKMNTCLVM